MERGPEVCQQALRCHLRTVNTIRNAHPVVGIPGQCQARETLPQCLDTCHAVEVANMVLRHGLLVSATLMQRGSPLIPRSRRRSWYTACCLFASERASCSGCKAPPTKARRST